MFLLTAQAACLGSAMGTVGARCLAKRRFVRTAGAELTVARLQRRMRCCLATGSESTFWGASVEVRYSNRCLKQMVTAVTSLAYASAAPTAPTAEAGVRCLCRPYERDVWDVGVRPSCGQPMVYVRRARLSSAN